MSDINAKAKTRSLQSLHIKRKKKKKKKKLLVIEYPVYYQMALTPHKKLPNVGE